MRTGRIVNISFECIQIIRYLKYCYGSEFTKLFISAVHRFMNIRYAIGKSTNNRDYAITHLKKNCSIRNIIGYH